MKSIYITGNVNRETTDILIITSPEFQEIIEQDFSEFGFSLKFYNIEQETIFEAAAARLSIFTYPTIHKYDKIIYLDTDILVNGDLNQILNLDISDNKIYAVAEGCIGDGGWGHQFFDFSKYNREQSAFSSGILFFRNSQVISDLFYVIQSHITEYIYIQKYKTPICLEQDFIVYNAITHNKYDNTLITPYVGMNPSDVDINKIIYHFLGYPGNSVNKYSRMTEFYTKINKIRGTLKLENIKTLKRVNIHDDIWTVSEQMRYDIADFFKDKTDFKVAELGAYKGYTTNFLSHVFSKVYAVDSSTDFMSICMDNNKERNNIEYVILDLYKDSWDKLPNHIEISFIDADHSYEGCKSDIMNSIAQFTNLKYIILDDYGVFEGVKKAVDEMIEHNILHFERFIGLTDVPSLSGVVKNVHEGIICSVDCKNVLKNKSYSWLSNYITFLPNGKMLAFGHGTYTKEDTYTFRADFGNATHRLVFNNDYTEFISTRMGDIVKGRLL